MPLQKFPLNWLLPAKPPAKVLSCELRAVAERCHESSNGCSPDIVFRRPRDFRRCLLLLCSKSISEAVLTVATCGLEARDAHGVARLSCDVKKPCCETLWPNFGCGMLNFDPRSVKEDGRTQYSINHWKLDKCYW